MQYVWLNMQLTLFIADFPPQSFHFATGSFPCALKISTAAPPFEGNAICFHECLKGNGQAMLYIEDLLN